MRGHMMDSRRLLQANERNEKVLRDILIYWTRVQRVVGLNVSKGFLLVFIKPKNFYFHISWFPAALMWWWWSVCETFTGSNKWPNTRALKTWGSDRLYNGRASTWLISICSSWIFRRNARAFFKWLQPRLSGTRHCVSAGVGIYLEVPKLRILTQWQEDFPGLCQTDRCCRSHTHRLAARR